MKKLLLSLAACAISLGAAAATVELTDGLNNSNIKGIPTAESAETSATLTSGNGVEYTFTNCFYNTKNQLFIMKNAGAAFTAKLTDKCTSIKLVGASNTTTTDETQIKLSVGDAEIETVAVDKTSRTFTFTIPAEYQAAGTTYTFERMGGTNRLTSIVYTLDKVEQEPWPTPEFNIPEDSYVLVGQEIGLTNVPDGATVSLSYKIKLNGTVVNVDGNSFTVPADAAVPGRIFVTARYSGSDKSTSTAELTLNLTNDRRPSVASFEYKGYECFRVDSKEYPGGAIIISYRIGIINLGKNTSKVTATVNLYDSEGTTIVKTITSDNLNVAEETTPAAQTDGIQPLEPTYLDKTITITPVDFGTYQFEISTTAATTTETAVKKGEYPIDFSVMTGIEDVRADENVEAEYYNLQGLRVAEPRRGQILIRVRGSRAEKILFR